MAATTTITVRVSTETREKLDRLAKLTDRSRSYLAAEALDVYLRNELEIIDGMLEATADFEAGRYYTHDEMVAFSDEIIRKAARRRARTSPTTKSTSGRRKAAA